MKKFFLFFAAFAVALTLCISCGDHPNTPDVPETPGNDTVVTPGDSLINDTTPATYSELIVGVWELVEYRENGTDKTDLMVTGAEPYVLTFNADATGVWDTESITDELFTWSIEGKILKMQFDYLAEWEIVQLDKYILKYAYDDEGSLEVFTFTRVTE